MGIKSHLNKTYILLTTLLYKILKKILREKISEEIINLSDIKIVDTSITLDTVEDCIIKQRKGVYMRFGDGDVFLMNMKRDSYQKTNLALAKEMKEAFECKGEHVHKCLAIHSERYGFEKGMFIGNHLVTDANAQNLLKDTFQFFIGEKIYSPIALHFKASIDLDRAKSFLKKLKIYSKVFVGNQTLECETLSKLFGEVKHIKTLEKNAYTEIERIYSDTKVELDKMNSFCVVVVAMGCSGRPLMKRLYNDNYNVYFFDFGSLLDGFNGDLTRTWLKKNDIDYEYLLKNL